MRNNSVNNRDRATGRFAVGNPGNPGNCNGGGRPMGTPNKAEWIRQQLFETVDEDTVRALAEGDPKLFWSVLCRLMPKQIQAEVGDVGSIGEACDAALRRAGLAGKFKTELGEV